MSCDESNIRVAEGGLMRCCTATIREKHDSGTLYELKPGEGFKCHYCVNWMRLEDDCVIRWWRDHE